MRIKIYSEITLKIFFEHTKQQLFSVNEIMIKKNSMNKSNIKKRINTLRGKMSKYFTRRSKISKF